MNARVSLGSGLEMIIVNSIDFGKDGNVMELVRQGVALQETVFKEQNVTFTDERVLRYRDSVGTRKNPGSLCEGQPYYHIYLTKEGKLIGVRVTQEFDGIELWARSGGKRVSVDYFPSLVLAEEQERRYAVQRSALGKKAIARLAPGEVKLLESLTPVEILMRFSGHLEYLDEPIAARFNDGLCLSKEALRQMQYSACEIKVPVPSLAAGTLREYNAPIDELTFFGKFDGVPPLLDEHGAERLLVQEYLIAGYVNSDDGGHILDGRGRRLKAMVDGLECVKLLRQRISEAVASHGSILFRQV